MPVILSPLAPGVPFLPLVPFITSTVPLRFFPSESTKVILVPLVMFSVVIPVTLFP